MKNQNEQFDDILNQVIIVFISSIIVAIIRYLYNYYHTESLNKLTMYTLTNNICNKITKFVKSLFQYIFTQ